jgi:4-hydroxybenzoate polyprenyltransferase
MINLIKWWKDKTIITILITSLLTIVIGFILTYFIDCGWILTIIIAVIAGIFIRRTVINRIDKENNKF